MQQERQASGGRTRRNVTVSGRRTSVSLEIPVWDALDALCRRQHTTTSALLTRLDAVRGAGSLASAVRVFAVSYFRTLAEQGEVSLDGLLAGFEDTLP